MPARDQRTVGELLADSDALARDTLLDATPENAPAMIRSSNQLVASAVHLWAALASRPDSMWDRIRWSGCVLSAMATGSERSRWALARDHLIHLRKPAR